MHSVSARNIQQIMQNKFDKVSIGRLDSINNQNKHSSSIFNLDAQTACGRWGRTRSRSFESTWNICRKMRQHLRMHLLLQYRIRQWPALSTRLDSSRNKAWTLRRLFGNYQEGELLIIWSVLVFWGSKSFDFIRCNGKVYLRLHWSGWNLEPFFSHWPGQPPILWAALWSFWNWNIHYLLYLPCRLFCVQLGVADGLQCCCTWRSSLPWRNWLVWYILTH